MCLLLIWPVNFDKFDRCDNPRLIEIVTIDETWIHHFDPEKQR